MNRKTTIRALKYAIVALILITIILFAVSIHTLISGLANAISGDSMNLNLDQNTPNGDWILQLNANPKNTGLLEEKLSLSIGILNPTGQYIVAGNETVNIPPGQQKPLTITLTIPKQTVLEYNLNATEGANVKMELIFSIRTLADLTGFQQTMRISGAPNI